MNRASFDPRNTHEKQFRAYEDKMAPWHETCDVEQDPRNLAFRFVKTFEVLGQYFNCSVVRYSAINLLSVLRNLSNIEDSASYENTLSR